MPAVGDGPAAGSAAEQSEANAGAGPAKEGGVVRGEQDGGGVRSDSGTAGGDASAAEQIDAATAAGGVSAATRTLVVPTSRVSAWMFSNPLKWFRPTHAGIGIVDTLRAKYPQSKTLHDLSAELGRAPLQSSALILPAAAANFLTGVVMFSTYEITRANGVSAVPAGALSGLVTSVVTVPMEAVKRAAWRIRRDGEVRVAVGHPPPNVRFGATIVAIARKTRFSHLRGALWRIFVGREVVTTSVFFGTHTTIKTAMIRKRIEDGMDPTTHMHVMPTVCGAMAAGVTTRAALVPFDVLRDYYFEVAEHGASAQPLRARVQVPSSLTVLQSTLKTLPSALGLLTFEFALARERRQAASAGRTE